MLGKLKKDINYLDVVPKHRSHIAWKREDGGLVTLEIENKGAFNKLAQIAFKKPKVSYVHLDEFGSFAWEKIDGSKTVHEIAGLVKEKFGERAEPLYPRIAKFMQIVSSYDFIDLETKDQPSSDSQ